MSDDRQVAVEVEFQARMNALHEARARLTELDAALNRLEIDRHRLLSDEADDRHRRLTEQRSELAAEVERLHARAREARTAFRLATDIDAEPDDVADDEPVSGYQQPHFGDR